MANRFSCLTKRSRIQYFRCCTQHMPAHIKTVTCLVTSNLGLARQDAGQKAKSKWRCNHIKWVLNHHIKSVRVIFFGTTSIAKKTPSTVTYGVKPYWSCKAQNWLAQKKARTWWGEISAQLLGRRILIWIPIWIGSRFGRLTYSMVCLQKGWGGSALTWSRIDSLEIEGNGNRKRKTRLCKQQWDCSNGSWIMIVLMEADLVTKPLTIQSKKYYEYLKTKLNKT